MKEILKNVPVQIQWGEILHSSQNFFPPFHYVSLNASPVSRWQGGLFTPSMAVLADPEAVILGFRKTVTSRNSSSSQVLLFQDQKLTSLEAPSRYNHVKTFFFCIYFFL